MAYEFYVTIEGTKQGKFKGETAGKSAASQKIVGLAFDYAVRVPRDAMSGAASGKRQHLPIKFTCAVGAHSPQLFQALCTNETLKTVLFEFVRTDQKTGQENIYHTVKLVNASLSELRTYANAQPTGTPTVRELEDVSFTFQKIEVENLEGKMMAIDDVTAR